MHRAVHKFRSEPNEVERGSEVRDLTSHRHQPRKYGIPYPTDIPCICTATRGYDGHFDISNTSVAHGGCVLEKKSYGVFFSVGQDRWLFFFSVLIKYVLNIV